MKRFCLLAIAVSAVALGGCGKPRVVEARTARGPDGDVGWTRLECPHLDRRCFATVKAMCPDGFYFRQEGSKAKGGVTTLPPQEQWSKSMYSRSPGTLVVRCAKA